MHVARLLAARRAHLGLTLDEVCRQAESRGSPLLIPTLWRIERGQLDPGVRRLNVLLDIYGIEPDLAAELASLEAKVDELPAGDFFTLHKEARRAWEAGDASRTMACVFAMLFQSAHSDDEKLERHQALLFSAIAARGTGKLRLAKHIVDRMLCEAPPSSLMCDVLTIAASVWRLNGSIEVALAMIRQAKTHVADDDRTRRGRVAHQEAKLLLERGDVGEAAAMLDGAIQDYRVVGETLNEGRARLLGIAVREKQGRVEEAIVWAGETVEFATHHGHAMVTTHAYLELGRVLAAANRAEQAIDVLRRALSSALLLSDRNAEFHAHENLAAALDALGEHAKAAEERRLAQDCLDSVRSNERDPDWGPSSGGHGRPT